MKSKKKMAHFFSIILQTMFWLFYLSLVIKLAFITLYDSRWSAEWQDRSIVEIQRTQVLQSSANLGNSIPAQIQRLCYSSLGFVMCERENYAKHRS